MLRLRLKQFKQLESAEQLTLITALILLPMIAASLRVLGFKRCHNALQNMTPQSGSGDLQSNLARARATARLVDAAANHGPYRAKCLVRSMATQLLLAYQGIDCDLKIGVSKSRGGFEAHAWVICQGKVINDQADIDTHFQPFTKKTGITN